MDVKIQASKYLKGEFPARNSCCKNCAFKKGSPERSDIWEWMRLVDHWIESDKAVFFCHEGVHSHQEQVKGEPLMVCAGFHLKRVAGKIDFDLYSLADSPETYEQ